MRIVTRAEWGAKPARSRHVIDTPTPRLWLHHTAGNERGAAGVRSIQDFHMRPASRGGRGWSDIAYSLLVDPHTLTVYEGRGIGIAGGHTKGDNTESHAICVMGNFDTLHPSASLLRLIADLVREGREKGWWGELTGGHRNAPGASTACPGRFLQAAISEIQALSRATVPAPQEADDMFTDADRTTLEANRLYAIAALQVGERVAKAIAKLDADIPDNLEAEIDEIRKNLRTDLEHAGVPEDQVVR